MNPTNFKYGIRLPQAIEDNSKLKLVAIDDDGSIQAYITEIPASMLPPIAITSVIIATEITIADFASNSGSYIFEQGDVIVLDNGNGSYYMYNGGAKTNVSSYNEITASDIDWSQVTNVPTYITNPTLEDVLNNGIFGGINNNIILQGNGYLRTDNNIKIKPNLAITEAEDYSSIGVLSDDLFYLLQTKKSGDNSYYLGIDVSKLTDNRVIEAQDFAGKIPLLSSTETNDGDFEINGSFTGKGDGLTDVDAEKLTNYNLGTDAFTETLSDFDDNTALSGIYRVSSTTANNPMNASGVLYHMNSGSTGYISQAFQQINQLDTDRFLIRHYSVNLGNWSTWKEVIHSGNISEYAALPTEFYEEGTFTLTLTGGSYTFTVARNNYIRIGNKKTFYFTLTNINGTGSSGQNLSIGVGELLSDLCESTLRRITGSDITEEYKCEITNIAGNSVFIKRGDDLAQSNVDFTNGVLSGSITIITNVYTP